MPYIWFENYPSDDMLNESALGSERSSALFLETAAASHLLPKPEDE
jgi:hypothetical protein